MKEITPMADKNKFWISDADKEWVHNSFNWLIQAYGYPLRNLKPVLFTDEFFPTSFANNKIEVECLITDLSKLLN